MRAAAAALALALLPGIAAAQHQVRYIRIDVLPYYEAGPTRQDRPRVAVFNGHDGKLASNRRDDVAAVRDAILAEPALATPMTLMVLAIRLYDVGLRDDAAFWFYAAKDRFATVAGVLDTSSAALAKVEEATRNFALLAGPVINGYAFCDIARQKEQRRRALEWVAENPYQALFLEQIPARPGDRRANLERALAALRAQAKEEAAHLEAPGNAAKLAAARRADGADRKYCWS